MQSLHTRKAARKHTPQCQRGVCWQRCTCLNVRWAPVRLRRNKRLPQTLMTQRGSPAASAMTQQANVGNTKKKKKSERRNEGAREGRKEIERRFSTAINAKTKQTNKTNSKQPGRKGCVPAPLMRCISYLSFSQRPHPRRVRCRVPRVEVLLASGEEHAQLPGKHLRHHNLPKLKQEQRVRR